MEPTLPDGASILVDRNRRRRRVDHIFVVRTEDGLIVKRLGKTTADTALADTVSFGCVHLTGKLTIRRRSSGK